MRKKYKRYTRYSLEILKTQIHKIDTVALLSLFFNLVMCLKDADGMANSADPDQTALHCLLSLSWDNGACSDLSVTLHNIFIVNADQRAKSEVFVITCITKQ